MSDRPTLLLTGATGFVGAYVSRVLLRAGYPLRAIRRPNSNLDLLGKWSAQIEWVQADIQQVYELSEALEGVDTVIHMAALISFAKQDRKQLYRVNQYGTANLVNLALAGGVRRLIHLSSVAALGEPEREAPLHEGNRWRERPAPTHYGQSKFQAEREIWRGQAEGLSVASIYPSIILGAGRWSEGTPNLFPILDGGLSVYPTGSNGFVDVRDVADTILTVLQRDQNGDRFLLNAANLTYQELFTEISQQIGSTPPRRKVAGWQATLFSRWEALRARFTSGEALLTPEQARLLQSKQQYNNQHSLEVLGIRYRPWQQTVLETAAAYLMVKEQGQASLAPILLE